MKVYEEPRLHAYLARVASRLRPGAVVVVLADPTLNAFAMPDGRIYLHTGLLSRVANEAQLATVLAHELSHYTGRHALQVVRPGGRAPIVRGVLSPTAGAVLGLGLRLAATASITGYGRDLEREADGEGMKTLVVAGYDPQEARRGFQLLENVSADRGAPEIFFFGNRERLRERIDAAGELLRTTYAPAALAAGAVRNAEEFNLRMRPVVRDNAALDVRAGRFTLAQAQLDRVLDATPRDPIAQLAYGDLHRLRAQRVPTAAERAEQARKARERYERAAALDPAYSAPYRQLGLLYYQEGDAVRARAAFERYLALDPAAPDAPRIRGYVIELAR